MGGSFITLNINLETIPVFVKEGSFIPMVQQVNTTDNYSTKKLTLKYYYNSTSSIVSYTMFIDDGSTFGSINKNKFELLTFSCKHIDDNLTAFYVTDNGGDYKAKPQSRVIRLEVIGADNNKKQLFTINDNKLQKIKQNSKTKEGYYFDSTKNIWVLTFEVSN
jgi:oligosaccharide 4-alpha-D-glucosyltransferase